MWQQITVRGICVLALFAGCCGLSAQAPNPSRLFVDAVAAQERGDDLLAAAKYRELLRLHPEAVAVRVNLGAVLAHLQRFSEAIEQDRMVVAADPNNRMARFNLAQAYQAKGDIPAAIPVLEKLYRDDPGDGQALLLLADCELQSGRGSDVISLLAPLEPAQPDNPDIAWLLGSAFIQSGRAAEGVELVEKAAAMAANADAWLLAGKTRLGMSQFDLARRDAEAAEKLNPNLAGLATLRGMILEQTADYDGAETALHKALTADPNDFNAHYYLGAIFYFKRDMEKARRHLERALELEPNSAQARYEMALVSQADGQPDLALHDLERVVRDSPDWLEPHVELSALYYRLHRPQDGARQRRIVDRMLAAQQQTQSQAAR